MRRLLALEKRHVETLEWQAILVVKAMEATEEDHSVLDTIQVLLIHLRATCCPAPGHSSAFPLASTHCPAAGSPMAWDEVQQHLH
ncbi:hypothetical protein Y1Q_0004832 [Alligator mississippiensis]|uniref:Uncharacterized protein n=1 Tax=Alligator mississippiensis TaxID=8496 RepID=A0A151NRV1_ALLMI|nr:hypothetical protein Y1Q_0004832 [Alligator mississippiensis]